MPTAAAGSISLLETFLHDSTSGNASELLENSGQRGRNDTTWSVALTPNDVALILVLSFVIVTIFVGNVFVVLSVIVFCKMRTLSNGLIASLASADLLVSVLVLPISLQYEIVGRWTLGPYICDFWITSDVFCCTASILNIVVIAIDRYWLITKNVRYTHSSVFPRRKVCVTMLCIAWTVSALISFSPLFGWRKGTEKANPDICLISQDIGYTVFSTVSSFWLPLFVILIVYFKIFLFARQRVIRRTKQCLTKASPPASKGLISGRFLGRGYLHSRRFQLEKSADSLSPSESTVFQSRSRCADLVNADSLHLPEISETVQTSSTGGLKPNLDGGSEVPMLSGGYRTAPSLDENYGDFVFNGSYKSPDSDDIYGEPTSDGNNGLSGAGDSHQAPVSGGIQRSLASTASYPEFRVAAVAVTCVTRSQKSHSRRIRRSARTLGLIIGGFLVCWLPFFFVATIAPFCTPYEVPRFVQSLVLWLGYSNSLLNPAIYAIWEKTFRKSFRRLSTCDLR